MTVKAGQKCTAIRRTFVPAAHGGRRRSTALQEAARRRESRRSVDRGCAHGPARRTRPGARGASKTSSELRARDGARLRRTATLDVVGADPEKGAFFPATLLYYATSVRRTRAARRRGVRAGEHRHAVRHASTRRSSSRSWGREASSARCSRRDDDVAREVALGTAAYHGRLMLVNRHSAKESTGHGSPLPHLVHGGPGRAGGGEEMGGVRGVLHYMQRTALQGSPQTLTAVTREWIKGAAERARSRASRSGSTSRSSRSARRSSRIVARSRRATS